MSYTHLSASERFQLYQLRMTDKLSIQAIAKEMKRSKSTISRELKRNKVDETLYLPDTAQKKWKLVDNKLKEDSGALVPPV
jgi:IS30 family transposase